MADTNRDEYFEDRAGTDEARYHVVPDDNNGWAVKREGKDEPESTYESKSDAVDEGKKLAEDSKTMLYIHDDDGQIETQENYME